MSILPVLIILMGILIFRTLIIRRNGDTPMESSYIPNTVSKDALNRFSEIIRLKTVTYNDFSAIDIDEHRKMENFFKKSFPLASSKLELTKLNDFAYIFKWEGKNRTAKPVLLMAHFDVVPAQEDGWDFDPFGGEITDSEIRGRGTMDTKGSLMGILEAAEHLLSEDFTPESTLYFAFGGDEEIMGLRGAVEIVKYFKTRNISFSWVLDEGSVIGKDMLKMVGSPIALIGIAEKGFANVRLSAEAEPGHASMPPAHTASGLVAEAVYRIENNQFPSKLTKTVRGFLKSLVPHVKFSLAVIFSNLWLFAPIVKLIFKKSPTTAAMVRTTQAATVLKGSKKDNILPDYAEAIVNVRILPGETKDDVIRRMRRVIGNTGVKAEFTEEKDVSDPVKESDFKSSGYRSIVKTINKIYPDAVTAPFLVTATTDSRHYKEITDNIFRFVPMVLEGEDLKKIHGYNESISIENYQLIINFFTQLVKEI